MTEQYVSPDVEAIRNKRFKIENEICELYKNANLVLAAKNYANENEAQLLWSIQQMCLKMLQVSNI